MWYFYLCPTHVIIQISILKSEWLFAQNWFKQFCKIPLIHREHCFQILLHSPHVQELVLSCCVLVHNTFSTIHNALSTFLCPGYCFAVVLCIWCYRSQVVSQKHRRIYETCCAFNFAPYPLKHVSQSFKTKSYQQQYICTYAILCHEVRFIVQLCHIIHHGHSVLVNTEFKNWYSEWQESREAEVSMLFGPWTLTEPWGSPDKPCTVIFTPSVQGHSQYVPMWESCIFQEFWWGSYSVVTSIT